MDGFTEVRLKLRSREERSCGREATARSVATLFCSVIVSSGVPIHESRAAPTTVIGMLPSASLEPDDRPVEARLMAFGSDPSFSMALGVR